MEKQLYTYGGSWFGYKRPEDSPAVWGARAIHKNLEPLDFLYDRQGFYGTEKSTKALETILNYCGLMDLIRAKTTYLSREYIITSKEAKEVVIYEDMFLKVLVNTNGSGGYAYISAFIKPCPIEDIAFEVDEPWNARTVEGDEFGHLTRVRSDGKLVWSNEELPQVGEHIYLTHSRVKEAMYKSVVLGHAQQNGFLFLVTCPSDTLDRQHFSKYLSEEGKIKLSWLKEGREAHGWKDMFEQARKFKDRMFYEHNVNILKEDFSPPHWMTIGGKNILQVYRDLETDIHPIRMPYKYVMGREWFPLDYEERALAK